MVGRIGNAQLTPMQSAFRTGHAHGSDRVFQALLEKIIHGAANSGAGQSSQLIPQILKDVATGKVDPQTAAQLIEAATQTGTPPTGNTGTGNGQSDDVLKQLIQTIGQVVQTLIQSVTQLLQTAIQAFAPLIQAALQVAAPLIQAAGEAALAGALVA